MAVKSYFFDTYALHEILEGNPNYLKYAEDVGIITTKLNLMEIYYDYLSKKGRVVAEKIYSYLKNSAIDLDDDLIKEAMNFRLEIKTKNPKSNVSYADAVGYIAAKRNMVKFLTGDREFGDLDNVEFVK